MDKVNSASTVPPTDNKPSYDVVWKVVLTGNSGVGKTNFLTRYAWNQFTLDSRTTLGIDFACKDVEVDGKKVRLQVWDTAGQERYRVLSHLYYNQALAVILVYDITKHTSFQDVIKKWLKEVQDTPGLDDPVLILVGHKYDLRHLRIVTTEEAQKLADEHNMLWLEASAMDDYNIEETFKLVVDGISKREKLRALMSPPLPAVDDSKIKLKKADMEFSEGKSSRRCKKKKHKLKLKKCNC